MDSTIFTWQRIAFALVWSKLLAIYFILLILFRIS